MDEEQNFQLTKGHYNLRGSLFMLNKILTNNSQGKLIKDSETIHRQRKNKHLVHKFLN